jgi:23S rRNA (uracil1939-C5)-methyltransferase
MQLRIEKLVYGGEGLGHSDGRAVFVPFVLPGEVVRIEPLERRKKFVRGRAREILEPSALRAAPRCRHFTQCGGCHYQHIPGAQQLACKADILRETLARIGGVRWQDEIVAHASPEFGYRNRAQWKVRPQGRGAAIGYFRAGSSALCAAEECPVLSPRLSEALEAFAALLRDGRLPATPREVEVFADAADERALVNLSCAELSPAPLEMAGAVRRAMPFVESVLLYDMRTERFELDGPGFLRYLVGERSLRVGHLSFFQANRFLLGDLLECAISGAGGALALDLYSGAGFFAHQLAERFARLIAVESNEAAARDLEENLAAAGAGARVVKSDVTKFLSRWDERPDLVLLDPPRAGADAAALERLASLAPEEIRYVSCDPATLGRDLARLAAAGYAIRSLHLFDMFPQTYHIESLAILGRGA